MKMINIAWLIPSEQLFTKVREMYTWRSWLQLQPGPLLKKRRKAAGKLASAKQVYYTLITGLNSTACSSKSRYPIFSPSTTLSAHAPPAKDFRRYWELTVN